MVVYIYIYIKYLNKWYIIGKANIHQTGRWSISFAQIKLKSVGQLYC